MATDPPQAPEKKRIRQRTRTRTFGASKRENHNAETFYSSKLYQGQTRPQKVAYRETPLPEEVTNQLFCQSSESMAELPDESVHLMITSPPYNASKQFDIDMSLKDYTELLEQVFSETHRVLVPGGRACVNVANLGRSPYIPLHTIIINLMLSQGYLMRGEIIWDKGTSAGISTAWGSWRSPSNPALRDTHEYILVFSKESFSRPRLGRQATISKAEFVNFTKSLWQFRTVSAKKVGHPAPFPEELPYRLIQLYSFENDVILDPFCGSGTTCLVAHNNNRRYVGYDINSDYIELAKTRLSPGLSGVVQS